MPDGYDLVVIGSGVAGNKVALKCAGRGWRVALVEERPPGGTCALRGCNPKKVLTSAAEVMDRLQRMEGRGLTPGSGIDWERLIDFKGTFVKEVPEGHRRNYDRAGITVYRGKASFVDRLSLRVGDYLVEGDKMLIATGARPSPLGVEGEELLTLSDDFLDMRSLPKRLLFVGGGYVSMEFSHVTATAGFRTRVLHRGDRVLKGFDPDLAERMAEVSGEMGVEMCLGQELHALRREGGELVVEALHDGLPVEHRTDLAVHGAGREPNLEGLGLDLAGVRYDGRGILVNGHMQSISNPDVYAAGDVTAGRMPLSSVADHEAFVVGNNLLKGNQMEVDYTGIPTVVFTSPPLARVGVTVKEAEEKGLDFEVKQGDRTGSNSERRVASRYSGYKVLVENGTGSILGAHLMGHHAEESINVFGLAMRYGLTAGQIKSMPFSFPTGVYDTRYMV
ncbi:MAG: dihydrolipoyl dehydrogenase family protein [Thermoplasmatota archaeon]